MRSSQQPLRIWLHSFRCCNSHLNSSHPSIPHRTSRRQRLRRGEGSWFLTFALTAGAASFLSADLLATITLAAIATAITFLTLADRTTLAAALDRHLLDISRIAGAATEPFVAIAVALHDHDLAGATGRTVALRSRGRLAASVGAGSLIEAAHLCTKGTATLVTARGSNAAEKNQTADRREGDQETNSLRHLRSPSVNATRPRHTIPQWCAGPRWKQSCFRRRCRKFYDLRH
jgi:hypothetical protein